MLEFEINPTYLNAMKTEKNFFYTIIQYSVNKDDCDAVILLCYSKNRTSILKYSLKEYKDKERNCFERNPFQRRNSIELNY